MLRLNAEISNNMNIYCISDSHFGHENMVNWALRPKNFDDLIWKGITALPEDCVLLHLGDVSMGSDAITHMRLQNLSLKKWLVLGNHDSHSISWYLKNGWDFVASEVVLEMFGKKFLFTHMPQSKREGIDKNIHGHLHGGKSRKRPDFYDESYHIEVCPEVVGYNPVKLSGNF